MFEKIKSFYKRWIKYRRRPKYTDMGLDYASATLYKAGWELRELWAMSSVLQFQKDLIYLDVHWLGGYNVCIYENGDLGKRINDHSLSEDQLKIYIDLVKNCSNLEQCIIAIHNYKMNNILNKLD